MSSKITIDYNFRKQARRVSTSESIDELLDEVDPPAKQISPTGQQQDDLVAKDKYLVNGKGSGSPEAKQGTSKGFQPRDDAKLPKDDKKKEPPKRYRLHVSVCIPSSDWCMPLGTSMFECELYTCVY